MKRKSLLHHLPTILLCYVTDQTPALGFSSYWQFGPSNQISGKYWVKINKSAQIKATNNFWCIISVDHLIHGTAEASDALTTIVTFITRNIVSSANQPSENARVPKTNIKHQRRSVDQCSCICSGTLRSCERQ